MAKSDFGLKDEDSIYPKRTAALRQYIAAIREANELTEAQKTLAIELVKGEIETLSKRYTASVNIELQKKAAEADAISEKAANKRKQDAEIAAKQAKERANRILDIQKSAGEELLRQEAELRNDIEKITIGDERTRAGIIALSDLERKASIQNIDDKEKELRANNALNDSLSASLDKVRELTNQKYAISLSLDLKEFDAELLEIKNNLAKKISDAASGNRETALRLNFDENSGNNPISDFMQGAAIATLEASKAKDRIMDDFAAIKSEIEKSAISIAEKEILIADAALQREASIANAEKEAQIGRNATYTKYIEEIIKLDDATKAAIDAITQRETAKKNS